MKRWRHETLQKEFFFILDYFLPFDPPINLKNQNFEKMRKTPGNIIALHLRTTNDDHDVWFLRYKAWQTECFVILDYFLPFSPLTIQKIKILHKCIILHKCNKNHDHMLYCSWDMARDVCNFYFSFRAIFCSFIIILHQCTINDNHMMYSSWEMKRNRQNFFVILCIFCR